jgi:hypothetical protein
VLELVICERCGSLRARDEKCDVCGLADRALEDPTAGHETARTSGSEALATIQDASPFDLSSRIALVRSSAAVDVAALSVMEREFLDALADDARLDAVAARLAVTPQGAARLAASLLERGVIVAQVVPPD